MIMNELEEILRLLKQYKVKSYADQKYQIEFKTEFDIPEEEGLFEIPVAPSN